MKRLLLGLTVLSAVSVPLGAHAYYKTITRTGYYSIAVDGNFVWGGSAGPNAQSGGAPQTKLWRLNLADGTTEMWTLETDVGMKGTVAGIVPLADKVLVLVSGAGWDGYAGRPPKTGTDATYVFTPMRNIDGGIASFDRASKGFSILNAPVYDIEGYRLQGNDLWLSCGDQGNPRLFRAYRYNVQTQQLDGISGLSDSHCVAVEPESDRGFTGTHHGNGIEVFKISTLAKTSSFYGDAPALAVPEQVIDVTTPSPTPPQAATYAKPYMGLVKSMVKIDNQLWLIDPMGAWYAKWFGGVVLVDLPSLTTKWASPAMWQYRDFGDETALDLKLDPADNTIIWASGAKGLFKLHRTESPPRLEQIDIDGLLDHNFQHIAVDTTYVWAGTEQGYLYRFDKAGAKWASLGNWRTQLTRPVAIGSRQVPGAVTGLAATANGSTVTIAWQAPASPPAGSYFVSRDDVLVGIAASTSFTDTPPPGSHTYAVVPNEAPHLKGGLLGPSASTAVTVAGTPPTPPDCSSRPVTIAWGLGEMSYIRPLDSYADIYEFPNTKGVYPLSNVTHPQAKQLAAWQGKRLPSNDEYTVLSGTELPGGGVGHPDWADDGNASSFWDYNHFGARSFRPSGSLDNSIGFGLYDVVGSVMEWLSDYSPLGDGKTYGLAASGSYPEVAFGWRIYAPCAEYPAGSWARNIDRYNHSQLGLRAVMAGPQALHMLNPACASDAGPPVVPPVSDAGPVKDATAGGPADAAAGAGGSSGAAGRSGAGGSSASAGGSGTAGRPGAGGKSASAGSSGTADSGEADTSDPESNGSCGCRVATSRSPAPLFGMLFALAIRRRRHRQRFRPSARGETRTLKPFGAGT